MKTLIVHGTFFFIIMSNITLAGASNILLDNPMRDKEKIIESEIDLIVTVLSSDGFNDFQVEEIKNKWLTAFSMRELVEKVYLAYKKNDNEIFVPKHLIGEFGACKTYSMGVDHRYSHCGEVIRKSHIIKDVIYKSENIKKVIVYDVEKITEGLYHKVISVDANGISISGKYTSIKDTKGMKFFDVYEWKYNNHLSLKYDTMNNMYTMDVNGTKYVFQINNGRVVNLIK